MSIAKKFKTAVSGIVAGTMLFTSASVFPPKESISEVETYAASLCTVNTNKTYQRIRGFGGMNLPEWISEGDLTDAQRQKAFGNGKDELGLTILRIYVSDDKNSWSRAVPTAKYAQKMGATVFATPWNPPSSIRENGGGGFQTGKYHLNSSKYAAYAQHLNDYYTYMKNQGVDVYSISVQNEPDYSKEWTGWTSDETTSFLANYGDKLNFRVMSPESFQYTNKDYYTKILNNQKAFENTDLFGTHFYGTQRSQMDFSALESSGKEIWMTEVYVPNSNANSANNWPEALQVSENIHNGLVVGNMSAYTWWYIRRSYGLMTEDGKISKRGYCMAQYSKFVRPGDYRIDVTEQPASDVYVSAYKHSDTQVEIVAINKGSSSYAQEFSLGGRTITDIDRYRTSSNENIALTENLDNNGSSFFAQLPAQSVSTFVVTLESDGKDLPKDPYTPVADEPDANGYYFKDTFEGSTCDWQARGGDASVLTSGRTAYEGSEALLIQDRTAAWNGAQKSLSTVTFKPGEEYSFSVCAAYLDGTASTQTMMLSLEYKDSAGETKYDHIAQAKAVKGGYVQLANTNYKIPAGATGVSLYVETEDGTGNFYIDNAIAAVKGTKIDGPAEVNLVLGDINFDNVINSFDLVLLKQGLITGEFLNQTAALAADVNQNGKNDIADAVMLMEFLLGDITEFTKGTSGGDSEDSGERMSMADFTKKIESQLVNVEPADSHYEKSGVQYGTVKSGTYYSTTAGRNKPYNILLPAGYDESKTYPVLYVMHGYWENQNRMIIEGNGTMYTKQIIGNAIASGEAKDMIVVFPYIYTSKTQADCTAMDDANNAAYDNFINELTTDLMPYIEKNYSVKTGKNNTAITGFSMGGRESLLIGMKLSDIFGYVGAICPAPGVTGSFKWESGKEPYLLFITAGDNDTVVYSTPSGYNDSFTQNNVPHIWHYVKGGYHGDNSIHAHLYNFVRAVFQA